ncbi:siderophore-interacting protein [Marisediminicola sp. LYQ134]|uniref:siderophore-interacting protein n=1 Tax=Marisediminicola sp. LYQ134 TaxID=3391061 RepID=UPI003982DE95
MPFELVRTPLDLLRREATLTERVWVTPNYVRVRLVGEDLREFTTLGSDDHVRVFFPTESTDSASWPSREYTPIPVPPGSRELGTATNTPETTDTPGALDLEFVVHSHSAPSAECDPASLTGVGSTWASTAPLGASVVVGGPRGSLVVDGRPDAWLLAGDETAIPAIRRFIGLMPADAVGQVIVEVVDSDHEHDLDAPEGVDVRWVHRGNHGRESAALAAALDGITAHERPEGDVFGFVAAEQSIVRAGRALLLERWGLEADHTIIKGYWKRGDDAFHAPH